MASAYDSWRHLSVEAGFLVVSVEAREQLHCFFIPVALKALCSEFTSWFNFMLT